MLEVLQLTNFRNHQELTLELSPTLNVISGPNGSGKTNLLEAISFLSNLKPFRGQFDHEVINFNENMAFVAGKSTDKTLEVKIERLGGTNYSHKTFQINGVSKRSSHKFVGELPVVAFLPQGVDRMLSSKSERRGLLSTLCTHMSSLHRYELNRYVKIVKSRNAVLAQIRQGNSPAELDIWDEQLIESGTKVSGFRQGIVERVNEELGGARLNLGLPADLILTYRTSELTPERLRLFRSRDLSYGHTLSGPHRDEVSFLLGGREVSHFASRGEQRLVLLAFKLAELSLIEAETGIKPILLLDDVMSELDDNHQKILMDLFPKYQTFLTTAEYASIKSLLPKNHLLIELKN